MADTVDLLDYPESRMAIIDAIFDQDKYEWNGDQDSWDMVSNGIIPDDFFDASEELESLINRFAFVDGSFDLTNENNFRIDYNDGEISFILSATFTFKFDVTKRNDDYELDYDDEDYDEDEAYTTEEEEVDRYGDFYCRFKWNKLVGIWATCHLPEGAGTIEASVWPEPKELVYEPTDQEKNPDY